jgi:hypothetical protein
MPMSIVVFGNEIVGSAANPSAVVIATEKAASMRNIKNSIVISGYDIVTYPANLSVQPSWLKPLLRQTVTHLILNVDQTFVIWLIF